MTYDHSRKIMKERKHRGKLMKQMKKPVYQKSPAKNRHKTDIRTPMRFNFEPPPSYRDEICGIPVPTGVDSVLSVPKDADVVVVITVAP
jgi:hypothetical protein